MLTQDQSGKLWNLIKPIKVGMLVTAGGGFLRARPMHLVQDEFDDGVLWFFNNRGSEKTEEIAEESEVCVTFADLGRESYVSLTGTATSSRDPATIKRFWNPFVAAWFPQGKADPSVSLLRIAVGRAEYWDSTSSHMVQLFEFMKANITKRPPELGEHGEMKG